MARTFSAGWGGRELLAPQLGLGEASKAAAVELLQQEQVMERHACNVNGKNGMPDVESAVSAASHTSQWAILVSTLQPSHARHALARPCRRPCPP